jgi:hypothetical protein
MLQQMKLEEAAAAQRAYVSIRQHTSAYVSIRQLPLRNALQPMLTYADEC